MGHDAAGFLTSPILLALVDEAARGSALRVLKLVVGKGGGEQPLPSKGKWHT
jgi:phage-related tail fiber protein